MFGSMSLISNGGPGGVEERHAINPEYYGCIENMDIAIGKLMNYLKETESGR